MLFLGIVMMPFYYVSKPIPSTVTSISATFTVMTAILDEVRARFLTLSDWCM